MRIPTGLIQMDPELWKREFRGKIPKKSEREKARFGVGEGHHERCSEENKENKENTEYK